MVTGPIISKAEIAHRQYLKFGSSVTAKYLDVSSGKAVTLEKAPDHTIAAIGFEYGYNFLNGTELTGLLEGQHFFGLTKRQRVAIDSFQADILIGARFAFNDVEDKQLLLSFIFDTERKQEYLINFNYSQRLTEQWGIKLGLRRIIAPQKGTTKLGLERLNQANQYFRKCD